MSGIERERLIDAAQRLHQIGRLSGGRLKRLRRQPYQFLDLLSKPFGGLPRGAGRRRLVEAPASGAHARVGCREGGRRAKTRLRARQVVGAQALVDVGQRAREVEFQLHGRLFLPNALGQLRDLRHRRIDLVRLLQRLQGGRELLPLQRHPRLRHQGRHALLPLLTFLCLPLPLRDRSLRAPQLVERGGDERT